MFAFRVARRYVIIQSIYTIGVPKNKKYILKNLFHVLTTTSTKQSILLDLVSKDLFTYAVKTSQRIRTSKIQ